MTTAMPVVQSDGLCNRLGARHGNGYTRSSEASMSPDDKGGGLEALCRWKPSAATMLSASIRHEYRTHRGCSGARSGRRSASEPAMRQVHPALALRSSNSNQALVIQANVESFQ